MSIKDIITLAQLKDGISIVGLGTIVLMTLIQFSSIKLNPWDAVFKWLGNKLNADLKNQISEVKKNLDSHIKSSKEKDLRDSRVNILNFCTACINGQNHTKEQFEFMIAQCDDYEKYIEENKIKNGVVTSAIKEIRRRYEDCMRFGGFFNEPED